MITFIDHVGTSGSSLTWNPSDKNAGVTLSNGDMTSVAAAFNQAVRGTIGKSSGKWYFEVKFDTSINFGTAGILLSTGSLSSYVGGTADGYGRATDKKYNSTSTTVGNVLVDGDVLGVAFDATNGKVWFARNNTWDDLGDPVGSTNESFGSIPAGTYYPASSPYGSASGQHTIQQTLTYSPPLGYSIW